MTCLPISSNYQLWQLLEVWLYCLMIALLLVFFLQIGSWSISILCSRLVIIICFVITSLFLCFSILSKVFEIVIHRQVSTYFWSDDLWNSAPSDFHSGYSTQDVLLKVTTDWKLALDIIDLVGIAFIDLHKAFDFTYHSLLFAKLVAYRLNDVCDGSEVIYVINWQQVVLDHVYFEWATVMCGVLQGSVLGLFLKQPPRTSSQYYLSLLIIGWIFILCVTCLLFAKSISMFSS